MLSISAMANGQENYYLNLAREDYYLAGGEPPGIWHGKGASDLGLSGQVQGEALTQLLKGFHPHDGRALIQNAGDNNHQPGWDLTFSAPKSVSVAWSQATSDTQRLIQQAHAAAVRAALSYIEQAASITRRGKNGVELKQAHLIVATFEHGTSRAQDCQLHTHALLINVCTTEGDGQTRTLLSHPVYKAKMTAGAVYRAELAHQLEQSLGWSIERKGQNFEVAGVSQELSRVFSTRRREIEAALNSFNSDSAAAAAARIVARRCSTSKRRAIKRSTIIKTLPRRSRCAIFMRSWQTKKRIKRVCAARLNLAKTKLYGLNLHLILMKRPESS